MSWFNRYVVAQISPRAALRREMAMHSLKALYEAGEPTRYRKIRNDRKSADANMRRSAEPIRSIARHLDENFDLASGILDVLVDNVVGSGIQPEPQVQLKSGKPATGLNKQLSKLFDDWRFRPEVTWQHDYYGLQRLMARAWFRDGEVFGQRITGTVIGLDHGTIVPYSIEALEADMVPYGLDDRDKGIFQGIEISAWRRPRAYHVYKFHPGDDQSFSTDTKRLSAETVMHLAFRKRIHQLRGMSIFSSICNRLDDIKEIDEFERIAAKVAASMAAFIKKGQPDMYEPSTEVDSEGRPAMRELQMEPGLIFDDLGEGEDIGTIDTKRPNNALIPFRDSQLKAVAAGSRTGASSISKNYNGSYSSQRQELVEGRGGYVSLMNTFVYGVAQPVWDGFVDAAKAARKLDIPKDMDPDTLYDCTHTGPAMPWIDPEKEVDAAIKALDKGLTSRSRVIRARGDSPDQINREILRDREEKKELGIEDVPAKTDEKPAPKPGEEAPAEDPDQTEPAKEAA